MFRRSGPSTSAARAARAHELKTDAGPAAELLAFYAALVEYQQRLLDQGSDPRMWRGGRTPEMADSSRISGSLLHEIDSEWVGRAVRDFILWVVRLRPDLPYMPDVAAEEWRQLFESYRTSPDDAAGRFSDAAVFALEAVLQPVAECLAATHLSTARDAIHPRCPACGGAPVVGVLREEGHGAKRRLVCGVCLTEWDYLRLVCVKCGEQRFEALPVFTAEQFFQARVEACDTCRSYLKTIDATKDGRVVPVVDDLATVALDLWAREQGYRRVRANLARI